MSMLLSETLALVKKDLEESQNAARWCNLSYSREEYAYSTALIRSIEVELFEERMSNFNKKKRGQQEMIL